MRPRGAPVAELGDDNLSEARAAPRQHVERGTQAHAPSHENAVATTHRPGATIACFYDAAKPSNAVLVQRAVPEPGTSPWVPGGIVSGVLFVFGLVMLLVKPDRRRHVDA